MKRKALAYIDLSDEKNPTLKMQSRKGFQQDLADFPDGCKVWVTIEKYRKQRSPAQNGVLHWYCTELAEYLGMEREEVKSMMKLKFLQQAKLDRDGQEIVDRETGEIMMYIPSTADLNTLEMAEFTEKIRIWAVQYLDYVLPEPDKNYKLFKHLDNPK